ncbi:hypothetical protein B2J88_51580 [Rhodococcus sp. SRB_17]|nr:hypothetical protein [Rhodococcus sp. SRB_17]
MTDKKPRIPTIDEMRAQFDADSIIKAATPRRGRGAAWERVLESVAARLGSEWTVIGHGLHAQLLHVPIGWWFDTVAIDPIPNREQLYYSHQPVMKPLSPEVITMRQDLYERLHRNTSHAGQRLDIFDTDSAVELVSWWALGPSLTAFTDRSIEQVSAGKERVYAARQERPHFDWTVLAGLRVITDTGSPLDVIDNALDSLAGRRLSDDRLIPFWHEFRSVAESGDRARTLRWLDHHRRATVREHFPLPDSAFADALAGLDDQ